MSESAPRLPLFNCALFSPAPIKPPLPPPIIAHHLARRRVAGLRRPIQTSMSAVTAADGPAARLWAKFREEAAVVLLSPFVVCMAAGSLPMEDFHGCITQEKYYLKAFVKAYEMAEEWADDDDDKVAMREMRENSIQNLKVLDSVLQEWGVDLAKERNPTMATSKYTDFLTATASGKVDGEKGLLKLGTPFEKTKIAAYTVGAMIPCLKLFAYIAKEVHKFLDPDDSCHLYRKWINNYSSEIFEASVVQIEDLLYNLSVSLTGEELDIIERLYHQALKLEIDFFSSLAVGQRSVIPFCKMHDPAKDRLVIFSDFDLACTVVDSSAILAEIAIQSAPKTDQIVPEKLNAQKPYTEIKVKWDSISKQYTDEYELCIDSILSSDKVESFNYQGLCKALEQVSIFEKQANSRVIELGVLKGLDLEDVKRAGEHLVLQNGCMNFFQQVVARKVELNVDIHLISYCWCGDIIRSAFSSGGLDSLNVHSNELAYESTLTTGEIVKKIESPIEKVQTFKDILLKSGGPGKHVSDTVGDLLCLLEADVGIVIGSSLSFRRLCHHFGVSFVPLSAGVMRKQKELVEGSIPWKGLSGVLYEVSGWAEIKAFLLSSSQQHSS